MCAIKGMAYALNKPCIGISTLEGLAYNLIDNDCIVVATMDARRQQVYNAVFDITDGRVVRLTEDRAISIEDLYKEIIEKYESCKKTVYLVGDGAKLCYNEFENNDVIKVASQCIRYQKASSVGTAAFDKDINEHLNCSELMPCYLRLSQAERELKLKNKK